MGEKEDSMDDVIIIEDSGNEAEMDDQMEIEAEDGIENVAVEDVDEEIEHELEKEVEGKVERKVEGKVEKKVEKEEKESIGLVKADKMHFERNEDGKFKCPYPSCNFASKHRYNLINHIRSIHTDEKPYSCDYCEKKFPTSSHRSHHMKSHMRRATEKQFSCQYCDKKFHFRQACNQHTLTHPETNSVKCNSCSRRLNLR